MTNSNAPIIVTLAGHLGSGKSSLAKKLCTELGADFYSTGAAQRKLADELGVTTLELNQMAETDKSIDDRIDSIFAELSDTDVPLVVDSRMAFHFIPRSFKIRLTVDAKIAAERIMNDDKRSSENYESLEEAIDMIEKRRSSEQARFIRYYDVDIENPDNYDLIIDTSDKPVEEVNKLVCDALQSKDLC